MYPDALDSAQAPEASLLLYGCCSLPLHDLWRDCAALAPCSGSSAAEVAPCTRSVMLQFLALPSMHDDQRHIIGSLHLHLGPAAVVCGAAHDTWMAACRCPIDFCFTCLCPALGWVSTIPGTTSRGAAACASMLMSFRCATCSGAVGPLVPGLPVCWHSSVGRGVAPARQRRSQRVAAAAYHCGRCELLVVSVLAGRERGVKLHGCSPPPACCPSRSAMLSHSSSSGGEQELRIGPQSPS